MRFVGLMSVLLLWAGRVLAASPASPMDTTGGYHVVYGWPILPDNFVFGAVSGVGVDSHNRVFVFHRADVHWVDKLNDNPIRSAAIMAFDARTGNLLSLWGTNLFLDPHELNIDKDDNIWVTDCGLQQVLKFSNQGKLLMTVGVKGQSGLDAMHFNQPTDVAIAPDGSFYVSDGYVNNRVAKFSAEGKFLRDWGHKGTKPGEFDTPHSLTIDGEGRVYVADRGNARLQVFKGDGTFLYEWKSKQLGRPWAVRFGSDGFLYVVDGGDLRGDPYAGPPDRGAIMKLDLKGNIVAKWSRYGNYDGQIFWGHDIAVGKDGAVYVGEIQGRRVQKFVHK